MDPFQSPHPHLTNQAAVGCRIKAAPGKQTLYGGGGGVGEAIKCVLQCKKARLGYTTATAESSGYYRQGKAVFIYNMKACLSWTSITTT